MIFLTVFWYLAVGLALVTVCLILIYSAIFAVYFVEDLIEKRRNRDGKG